MTITLRGYGYVTGRNSNIAAWAAFARQLDKARFSVVIVPDTEQCFTGIPAELDGLPIFFEAAIAPGLRMALYQRAYLNLRRQQRTDGVVLAQRANPLHYVKKF